jgi:hypothetical protein
MGGLDAGRSGPAAFPLLAVRTTVSALHRAMDRWWHCSLRTEVRWTGATPEPSQMVHEAKVSRVSGRTIILTTMAHISVTWMATSSASAATTHQPSDLSRSSFSFGMMLAAMRRASSQVS